EVRNAGERLNLRLIGEKDVDPSAVDQLVEAVAVAFDAEGVGQSEGDLAARGPGDLDRPDHCIAGRFGVPQITFEIDRRRIADLLLVERACRKVLSSAEERIHRAMPV